MYYFKTLFFLHVFSFSTFFVGSFDGYLFDPTYQNSAPITRKIVYHKCQPIERLPETLARVNRVTKKTL